MFRACTHHKAGFSSGWWVSLVGGSHLSDDTLQAASEGRSGGHNAKHSKARNVSERSFGMMKTHWRSILMALEVNLTFVPEVVTCCAVLHNVCLSNEDIVDPEENNGGDLDQPQQLRYQLLRP